MRQQHRQAKASVSAVALPLSGLADFAVPQPQILTRLAELGQRILSGPVSKMLAQWRLAPAPQTPQGKDAEDLLAPARAGLFSLWERRAVAVFVATLAGNPAQRDYRQLLDQVQDSDGPLAELLLSGRDMGEAIVAEAHRLAGQPQPRYRASEALYHRLGDRLAVALEHGWHVLHGDAEDGDSHKRLLRYGWSQPEIAQLEQIIRQVIPSRAVTP